MSGEKGRNRSRDDRRRPIRFERLIILAAAIGVAGGALAAAYAWVLHGLLDGLWASGATGGGATPVPRLPVPLWALTAAGGLLVGLTLRYMGQPGEISAVVNNIHLKHGRLDVRQTPSMTVASLLSIAFGGSAGPEAPLVQIIGSLSSRLGDRLRLYGRHVRTLTFCGMAAALGAFFGAPLGGALFALEIPHRRGLEYYEALMPALVSAGLAFVVYRALAGGGGVLYGFARVPPVTLRTVAEGTAMGVVGAGVGAAFIAWFRLIEKATSPLHGRPVLLGLLGGLAIGLLALPLAGRLPFTVLFWSEFQIADVVNAAPALVAARGAWGVAALLIGVAALKATSIGVTLHTGFRGGFIFPLFFLGAVVGTAVATVAPGVVALPVAVACTMAAVNVAVTKTPVSTTVILTTLTGTSMLPVIGAASMASFLLTTRVHLIQSQRSRGATPA